MIINGRWTIEFPLLKKVDHGHVNCTKFLETFTIHPGSQNNIINYVKSWDINLWGIHICFETWQFILEAWAWGQQFNMCIMSEGVFLHTLWSMTFNFDQSFTKLMPFHFYSKFSCAHIKSEMIDATVLTPLAERRTAKKN